jgi:Bromodomain
VIESFPEQADAYLASISNPMDFRTIKEDRLHVYKSILELQEDLIIVFSNAMDYNEPGSAFHELAL